MNTPGATPNTYYAYAYVYDALKGDRSENIRLVRDLIQAYGPNTVRVLDIACGTGSIAAGLAQTYTVAGLDMSPHMLTIAKQKLPGVAFVQANMTHFSLPQPFDAAYCLHNSINHLLGMDDWRALFSRVATHLNPGGVFIFDTNPPEKMVSMAQAQAQVLEVGNASVSVSVDKHPQQDGYYYIWNVGVELPVGQSGERQMYHEAIQVCTFRHEEIMRELQAFFPRVESFTQQYTHAPDDRGRMYYIAIKGQ